MATAADILGIPTHRKVPSRWADHYRRLCAERDKLLERDSSTEGGFQPKLDDLADAAAHESDRSLSLVTATATHGLVVEVLEAIRRIEKGTYGICEITGEPIGAERLNSVPWTRYSIKGQQQIEESGLARRTALPVLEGLVGPEADEAESEDAEA